jgi:uracil-DNA glycosylase
MFMFSLKNSWGPYLNPEFEKDYYIKLRAFLKNEYNTKKIHPGPYDIFNALQLTPYEKVKIVILGQDPYHGPNQAHGLCFSVKPGTPAPPSLINIFQEIKNEFGYEFPNNGCLESWAKQGVLLLNTVLTVVESQPNSHKGKGWEIFTDRVIDVLNERDTPIVFLLWGNHAIAKKAKITNGIHSVLTAPHPSPLSASRGFFGCGHFRRANEILEQNGMEPINWRIPDL